MQMKVMALDPPVKFQPLLWWSSDTGDKGADWCTQVRCLFWGSFVGLSCSASTHWQTLLVLWLRSLIIPVICLLISFPSPSTQTTVREKGADLISVDVLWCMVEIHPYNGTYQEAQPLPLALHSHLCTHNSSYMKDRNLQGKKQPSTVKRQELYSYLYIKS